MPNWCSNDLYIIGPNQDAIAERVKTTDGSREIVFTFRNIVPRPAILEGTISGSQTPESLKHGDQAFKETGFRDWYEWSCAKWGTKWDASDPSLNRSPKRLKYTFETAWAPPEPVIEALSKMFPLNEMKLCFFERGMAYQGRRVYLAGEAIETWDGKYNGSRGG